MSYKKASIVVMSTLILLGIIGIYYALQIRSLFRTTFINGPRFYPVMLCSMIVLFSGISLIQALFAPDRHIELPNMKNFFFVLGVIIVWSVLWQTIGSFYLVSFFAVGGMLYWLNPAPNSLRKLGNTFVIDVIIIAIVYASFGLGLNISL